MTLLAPETIDVSMLPRVPLPERAQLPDVAAIYFVLDAMGRVQYIGRAKRLKIRWRGHHRIVEFAHIPQVRIAYLAVTDATLLPDIERALIEYFEPPCNRNCEFDAAINLKIPRVLRDSLLAKLRARRITMRAFLGDMMELADSDEDFLDMVEVRRMALGKERARHLVSASGDARRPTVPVAVGE